MERNERRAAPRIPTAFFAVEVRGEQIQYRLVRDISSGGFSFADQFPVEKPGDTITVELPLPGSPLPIRASGEVVYARSDLGVGVRIRDVDAKRYARLVAIPPPR